MIERQPRTYIQNRDRLSKPQKFLRRGVLPLAIIAGGATAATATGITQTAAHAVTAGANLVGSGITGAAKGVDIELNRDSQPVIPPRSELTKTFVTPPTDSTVAQEIETAYPQGVTAEANQELQAIIEKQQGGFSPVTGLTLHLPPAPKLDK